MNVSDISKLHAPTIVDSLLELEAIENTATSGKKPKKDANPNFSLNIPCNYVTKEVKKLRACDLSNHLYCREWTILYLRKFFNFSTREVLNSNVKNPGSGSITPPDDFFSNLLDIIQLRKNAFEASVSRYGFSFISYEDYLLNQIIETTHQKIRYYASSKNLQAFYNSLEISFDSLESSNSKYKDDTPSKILEAVDSKEKGFFSLPREKLNSLKYLNTSMQASLTFPVCNHSKENLLPDDIKELLESASTRLRKKLSESSNDWEIFSQEAWGLCLSFLDNMSQFNLTRIETLKNSESERSNNYHTRFYEDTMDQYSEYWPKAAERFRKRQNGKKKQDPEEVMFSLNELFVDFMDQVEAANSDFISLIEVDVRFVSSSADNLVKVLLHWLNLSSERLMRFDRINLFSSTLSNLLKRDFLFSGFHNLLVLLAKNFNMNEIPSGEKFKKSKEQILAKSQVARKIVEKKADILKSQLEEFMSSLKKNFSECMAQQRQISSEWMEHPKATVANKLEKASSKDFRKQVKRLEQSFSGLRNWAVEKLNSLLSIIEVSDLVTVCLEPLMLEAHLVHCVDFFTSFFSKYELLICENNKLRQIVNENFAEGTFHGRKMLSVIIGNLFLKEGSRILELIKFDVKKKELLDDWDASSNSDMKSPKKVTSPVIPGEPKAKKKNKKKAKKIEESKELPSPVPSSEASTHNTPESMASNLIGQPASSSLLLSILNPIFKQDKESASLSKNLKMIEPMLKSIETNIKFDLANHKKNTGPFPDNGLASFTPSSSPKDYITDFASFFNSTSTMEIQKSFKQLRDHYAKNMSAKSGKSPIVSESKLKDPEPSSKVKASTSSDKPINNKGFKSTSSAWISGDTPVDLLSLPKEKLIVFIEILLLDKKSLVDAFSKIRKHLSHVTSQFTKFLELTVQQDGAIIDQTKELHDLQQAVLCQDSQLLLLINKQNALRQSLIQFNELRGLLRRNIEDSGSSVSFDASSKRFQALDIENLISGDSQRNIGDSNPVIASSNNLDNASSSSLPSIGTLPVKGLKKNKRK